MAISSILPVLLEAEPHQLNLEPPLAHPPENVAVLDNCRRHLAPADAARAADSQILSAGPAPMLQFIEQLARPRIGAALAGADHEHVAVRRIRQTSFHLPYPWACHDAPFEPRKDRGS
jgi:hypothetical protein